jgi:uncharacterized protein
MRFEELVKVPVSVPEAWDFLWQVKRVAACLPGCRDVVEIEPGKTYKAQFQDSIGPYKANFDLDIVVQETRPQELISLTASGQDKRLGASQQVTMTVRLRPAGEQATILDVAADVVILGKIATLGQFAIKRKAKDTVEKFTRNISAELQRPQASRGSHA